MAVNTPQKFANDFWPTFNRLVATVIIISQVVILAIITLISFMFGFIEDNPIAFAGIVSAQVILGTLASIGISKLASRPIRDLLAAIIHVSGEPTASTPPNPNDARFAKNGFKDVLQTIYELALHDEQPVAVISSGPATAATALTPAQIAKPVTSSLEAALNETSCGFVVMNHERAITFSNKAAPLNIDSNGVSKLSLLFNGQETLDAWLDDCDKNAVHAEHTWSRVPNKLGRRTSFI